jgi:NADPH:quinone reductase-like Zn-dependent oxidoreductase
VAEVDRPTIEADDEVLVRVRATSVNTPDWAAVSGTPAVLRLRFGLRTPRTRVRGSDVAGVVAAVGKDVADLAPGDEVFGSVWDNSPTQRAGTFAEYAVAPASRLIRKPTSLPFTDAAAAVMSGVTALRIVRDAAQVGPGTRVLINGASGGVGTFAVQIARTLGAEVTGVCSTRNVDLVRSLGADRVIDYTRDDYTRHARRYDVIVDNVLNHPPRATARALAPGGVLIPNSIGSGGALLAGLPRMARAMLMGLGRTRVQPVNADITRGHLHDLATLLATGDVRSVIDATYPLEEAA